MELAPRRGLIACALVAAMIAAVPQTATALTPNRERALRGAAFIAEQQRRTGAICAFSCAGSTADAIVAIVAARADAPRVIGRAYRYLVRQVERGHVSDIGLRAKIVMAAVAAGAHPRSVGGVNLVAAIRGSEGGDGHFGSAAVYDQALSMLALRAVGIEPSHASMAWLRGGRCADGGWQYDLPSGAGDDQHCFDATAPDPGDFFTSDSNTSSLAIQVLRRGPAVDDALAFLPTLRDGSEGWGYSQCCTATDANSTALVIQAYVAAGVAIPGGGFGALRGLQLACGAWPYQAGGSADIGATIGAVPAIVRMTLPIVPRRPLAPLGSSPCG